MTTQSAILEGLQMRRKAKKPPAKENSISRKPQHTRQMAQGNNRLNSAVAETINRTTTATFPKPRRGQITEKVANVTIQDVKLITWEDGDRYIGEVSSDAPHGVGTILTAKGDVYDGEWRNSSAHGRGFYLWADGITYMGMWANGARHGIGSYLIDGETYNCEFANGRMIQFEGEVCEKVFFMKKK